MMDLTIEYLIEKLNGKWDLLLKSILTGLLLEDCSLDRNVIIAGYLSYLIDQDDFDEMEINLKFGGDVASLLLTAKRIKGDLSIEERIRQNNKNIIGLPDRNKMVLASKLITYLETEKNKKDSFSDIDGSKEKKEMLFKSITQHLAEDFEHPLIMQLYAILNELSLEGEMQDLYFTADYKGNLRELKRTITSRKSYLVILYKRDLAGKSLDEIVKMIFASKYYLKVDENLSEISSNKTDVLSLVEKNLLLSAALKGNVLEKLIDDEIVVLGNSYLIRAMEFLKQTMEEEKTDILELLNFINANYRLISRGLNTAFVNYSLFDDYDASYDDGFKELLRNCQKLIIDDVKDVDITKINGTYETVIITGMLLPYMNKKRIMNIRNSLNE